MPELWPKERLAIDGYGHGRRNNRPVVVAVEGDQRQVAKHSIRLTKAAQIGFRALHQAIDECGAIPPANVHIPSGVKAVTIDQWRDYAYRIGISTSDQPNGKRMALNRASEDLVTKQKMGIWEDYVWPVFD